MISIFNGRSRGLGVSPKKDVFLQVSVEMRRYLKVFTPYDYMVFTAISLHSSAEGVAYPSQELLGEETGLTRQTIIAAINRLCGVQIEGKNVLAKRKKLGEGGKFGTNEYLIFPSQEDLENGWEVKWASTVYVSPCTVEPDTVEPDTVAFTQRRTNSREEEPGLEEEPNKSVVDTALGGEEEDFLGGEFAPLPLSETDAVEVKPKQTLTHIEAECGRLYESFRNVAYPTEMPRSWPKAEFNAALTFLRQWVAEGRSCTDIGHATRAAVRLGYKQVTVRAVANNITNLLAAPEGNAPPPSAAPPLRFAPPPPVAPSRSVYDFAADAFEFDMNAEFPVFAQTNPATGEVQYRYFLVGQTGGIKGFVDILSGLSMAHSDVWPVLAYPPLKPGFVPSEADLSVGKIANLFALARKDYARRGLDETGRTRLELAA